MHGSTRGSIALLLVAAFALLACGPHAPQTGSASDTQRPWARGEVDTALSTGPVQYYKAVFTPGAPALVTAQASPAPVPGSGRAATSTTTPVKAESFSIVDYGPRGELPSDVKRPMVYVVFSKPVVPLAVLGAVMESTPLLKIEPATKGVYRWYGSRMLAFEASADMIAQRKYTVTVAKDLKALDGSPISGETGFGFSSEHLQLITLFPGRIEDVQGRYWDGYLDPDILNDVPPARSTDFLLGFNYPVDPAVTGRSIVVESGGAKIPFVASRPPEPVAAPDGSKASYPGGISRFIRIKLSKAPAFNTDVTVRLLAEARSDRESIPAGTETKKVFHSLLPFSLRSVDSYSWDFEESEDATGHPLYLEFSHPVSPTSIAGAISITPKVDLPATAIAAKGSTVRLNGLVLQPGTRYRIRVAASVMDTYGRSLPNPMTLNYDTDPESPVVHFSDRGTKILEATQTPKVAWQMRGVAPGGLRIAATPDPYLPPVTKGLAPFDPGKPKSGTSSFGFVDLAPWLGASGRGTVALDWSFTPLASSLRRGERATPITGSLRVQVTDLALTIRYGWNRALCLVSRLSDGKPVAGAKVSLMRDRTPLRSATTDASGLAVFALAPGEYRSSFIVPSSSSRDSDTRERDAFRVRIESSGDSLEFEPDQSHDIWTGPVQNWEDIRDIEKSHQVTMLFTDRGLYRPGEPLQFRGIDRDIKLGIYRPTTGGYTVDLMPQEWDGDPIQTLSGVLSPLGGFAGEFTLPEDLAPGEYSIRYRRAGSDDDGLREWFNIAYFERQLFAVEASSPGIPIVAGDSASVDFSASYLSGGALAGTPWAGYWTVENSYYSFGSEWDSWAFGTDKEWFRTSLGEQSGTLSADGTAKAVQSTAGFDLKGGPAIYSFSFTVNDQVSGRAIGASRNVEVHPAAFALGLRVPGSPGPWFSLASAGKPAQVEVVALTPSGQLYSGQAGRKLQVEVVQVEWKVARQQGAASRIHNRYERVETKVANLEATLAAVGTKDPARFSFTPASAGQYLVRVASKDDKGRAMRSELSIYVTGSGYVRWNPDRAEAIELTPDRKLYLPGQTARILVRSPLAAGRYLLTVEREGIFEQKIIQLDGATSSIELPVLDAYQPIVYVTLSSWTTRSGPAKTTWGQPDLDKPKGIFGLTALAVDIPARRIQLSIQPDRPDYRPGAKATVKIQARDSKGAPVKGAEISFMAADRAVLDLINYHVPDPAAHFYNTWRFPLGTMGADSRSILMDPVTYELKDLQGGGGDEKDSSYERRDFRPSAVFLPFLKTDATGTVEATFTWPDSLTTWRCTAVAVDAERFGLQESEIQVRNPITAKSLIPGRLRVRDTTMAGLLLTNLESTARDIAVDCASSFLVRADKDGSGKTIRLEPGQSGRVQFPFAAVDAGEGELRFVVRSGDFTDTLVTKVIVDKAPVTETVALAGSLGKNPTGRGNVGALPSSIEEGIVLPPADYSDGSLSIKVAQSILPTLGNSFSYLFSYPYGCLEQRISALMPLVLFGDRALGRGISSEVTDPDATIAEGLAYLARYQHSSGGFPYWPDGERPSRYVSVRAAHLFQEAKAREMALPEGLDLDALLEYLASTATGFERSPNLDAYADYVLALYGRKPVERTKARLDAGMREGLATYTMAALTASTMYNMTDARAAWTKIRNHLVPGLRGVDLSTEAPLGTGWYGAPASDIETLSLILMLALEMEPEGELPGKIAFSLLSRQRAGFWRSTAETVWALRALSLAIDAEGKPAAPGTLEAKASLGGRELLATDFTAGPEVEASFPLRSKELDSLPRNTTLPLALSVTGGILHYSATMRYSIPAELATARDEGLGVFTEILGPTGAATDPAKLVAGRVYRMRIMLTSPRTRSFVALRIPVPSGAMIIDSRFVTAVRIEPEDVDRGEIAWMPEMRQDIYDNEIRYFIDLMEPGRREMEFLFRAVTPGTYPLPPASAECMYEPEVFGRTSGSIAIIGEAASK